MLPGSTTKLCSDDQHHTINLVPRRGPFPDVLFGECSEPCNTLLNTKQKWVDEAG